MAGILAATSSARNSRDTFRGSFGNPTSTLCRPAGRLLQSQIVLQELRVSRRIGPGQNQRKRREIRLTAGKQSTMIPTRLSPLYS
jgi:hypothetical protein